MALTDSYKFKVIKASLPPIYKNGNDEILMRILAVIASSDNNIGGKQGG